MPNFSLSQDSVGPYPRLWLRHPDGRALAVLPQNGAAIHQIRLIAAGKPRDLLVSMHGAAEIAKNRWSKSAQLLPFPNRIRRGHYAFQGAEHQLPLNFPYEGGHAIHGFFCGLPWELSGQNLSESNSWLDFSCAVPQGHPGYPFPCRAGLRVGFRDEAFCLEVRLENLGAASLPAGWGWHPYFRTGTRIDLLELQLPPVRRLAVDEFNIPTGERRDFSGFARSAAVGDGFLDAGLELEATSGEVVSTLSDRAKGYAISLTQDAAVCRYLQVFTHPKRHGFAIEPMSCAVDAFNNGLGLQTVAPGAEFHAGCRVSVSDL